MKTLIMHKGALELIEIASPPCNPHSIKVKTIFSAVSYGTEANASKGQSLLKMTLDPQKWKKALEMLKISLNPFAVLQKYRNLAKIYQSVGYSLVGEVVEIGSKVDRTDIEIGDLVHCGGELAYHASYTVVPQNFVFKLDRDLRNSEKLPLLSAATIASVSVHGVERALDFIKSDKYNQAIVTGGGVIGFWAARFLKEKGFNKISVLDPSPKTMTDLEFPRYSGESANVILVCAPSMTGVDNLIENATDGVSVCIVGETPLQANRQILEDKYGVISFCKSFGYGRGNKAYEMGIAELADGAFSHTIRKNIQTSIDMMSNTDSILSTQLLNISRFDNVSLDSARINIIDWRNS